MKQLGKIQFRVETLDELKKEMSKEIIDDFFDRVYPYHMECKKRAQAGEIKGVPYDGAIDEWEDIHHVSIYRISEPTRELVFNLNGELIKYSPYEYFSVTTTPERR